MYWALDEEHPFKVAIRRCFTLNRSYSANEIQDIADSHSPVSSTQGTETKKVCSLIEEQYIPLSRTSGNKYTIRNENPRGFKEHTGRIATKENNLLKLFIL